MKIMPIGSINTNNTQFRAKFSKQNIQEFLREIENNDVDIVPKLYTMLDVIKKYSGQKAEIEHIGLWHRILIDGKSVCENNKYFSAFHALQDATVKTKSTLIKKNPIKRIPEDEFENEYYKNRKKTIQDIENIFEE